MSDSGETGDSGEYIDIGDSCETGNSDDAGDPDFLANFVPSGAPRALRGPLGPPKGPPGANTGRAQRVGFFQYRAGSGRLLKKKLGIGRVRVGYPIFRVNPKLSGIPAISGYPIPEEIQN